MPPHPGRLAAPTLLLAAILAAAAPVPMGHAAAAPALTDLAGHWAAGEIQAAVEAGWIGGYPNGTFRPDGNVTRAEFLSMLTRYLDTTHLVKPVTDERISFFQDRFADGGHWSARQGAVKGALAYQVLEPSDYPALFKGGELVGWSFAPDQPLTRLEAAVMLTRALGGKYEAERYHFHPGEVAAPPISFADGPQMADWARGWVAQAASSGVIKGYPDGSFGGGRPISRAEAVAMVRRLELAPRPKPSLLDEVRTHSADQPRLEALPRLAEANRNLVAELDLHVTGEADQDRWAVEHAWFQADPANRQATLQMWAVDFYRKVKAQELEPLRLKEVKVTFRTNDTNPIATVTYDGTGFTYSEMQPFAPAKEYPALAADLLNRLTVMDDRSAQAIERSKQNLAQIEHDLAHVKARTVLTFPYQYLADAGCPSTRWWAGRGSGPPPTLPRSAPRSRRWAASWRRWSCWSPPPVPPAGWPPTAACASATRCWPTRSSRSPSTVRWWMW